MDVHTRRLRYFVTVAEELHFGRAAERHFIAQQAISRQIRDLEEEVGTTLFTRTTRHVSLTSAGQVLLEAARSSLATLDEGIDAARAAARSSVGVLTVGFRFGAALELTAPILAAMTRDHPGVEVDLRELDFRVPGRTYDNKKVDVAITRTPTSCSELKLVPLLREPRVVAIGTGHPLSRNTSITVEDLDQTPIVVGDSNDEEWFAYWTLEKEYGGRSKPIIRVGSMMEELQLVAAGQACSITTAAAARYLPRPGITFVPIDGIDACTTFLAFEPPGSPAVHAFIETAVAVAEQETELVEFIANPFESAPRLEPAPRAQAAVADHA